MGYFFYQDNTTKKRLLRHYMLENKKSDYYLIKTLHLSLNILHFALSTSCRMPVSAKFGIGTVVAIGWLVDRYSVLSVLVCCGATLGDSIYAVHT